jgi:hypothetical protein
VPAAIRGFNGLYTVHGQFMMEDSMRILIDFGVLVLVAGIAIVRALARYIRRRRHTRTPLAEIQL